MGRKEEVQGQEVIEGGKDVEKGEKPYAGERCEPEGGHFEAGWRDRVV